MGAGHDHGPNPTELDPGAAGDFRKRLAIAFGLTATIVVAQAVGSILTGSLALLTDTAHAATDASGLLVALIAATMMLRPPSPKRTYGFRRIEVVAALGQATLLTVVGIFAGIEGIRRLFEPPEVAAGSMLWFGIIGLAANIIAIIVLSSARGANFNMRAAFLEVLNDALGSVGVIVAAIVIQTTGFQRADAIAGIFIATLIVPRALKIMRETLAVLMEFTPKDVDIEKVREYILSIDHVQDVHDLHATTVATGLPNITAHVVVDDACFQDGHVPDILHEIREGLSARFEASVKHSTIQLETAHLSEDEPDSLRHN